MCLFVPGHAGAVGPSPSNLQHQQIRAETESSGRPRHPQVLRLHQWETEIPQSFRVRSVFFSFAQQIMKNEMLQPQTLTPLSLYFISCR